MVNKDDEMNKNIQGLFCDVYCNDHFHQEHLT